MRVGLLGGTFDPPHIGHLVAAQDAQEQLNLREVRFVLAPRPPHKDVGPVASAEDRLAMVEAAVGGDPRFRVETREMERAGPSYTVDTLRELTEAEPAVSWVLLLGTDQLAALDTWHEPREVGRLARLVAMTREGQVARTCPVEGVSHDTVSVTRVDISSTAVRERIAQGRSAQYLVPAPVWDIIEQNGLYRD